MFGRYLASFGAFASALIVPAALIYGFVTGDEGWAEFFLIAAPIALAPCMVVMEFECYRERPYASFLVLSIGLLGVFAFTMVLAMLSLKHLGVSIADVGFASLLLLSGLIGLWMILSGWLGLRTQHLPRHVAVLGAVAGATWIGTLYLATLTFFAPETWHTLISQTILPEVIGAVWFISYLAYTIDLGVWTWHLGDEPEDVEVTAQSA